MKPKPLFLFSELSDDLTEKEEPKKKGVMAISKNKRVKATLGKRFDNVADVIGPVQMGESIHYASMGQWSLHDLLIHLLNQTGPAELTIATWSISEDAVRLILKEIDSGKITKLSMLLDWRIKVRRPEVLALVKNNITDIRVSSCHAKAAVICNDNWQIAIVGSANLTNNPRIEAGVISCDPIAAEFYQSWMHEEIKNSHPFGDDDGRRKL